MIPVKIEDVMRAFYRARPRVGEERPVLILTEPSKRLLYAELREGLRRQRLAVTEENADGTLRKLFGMAVLHADGTHDRLVWPGGNEAIVPSEGALRTAQRPLRGA